MGKKRERGIASVELLCVPCSVGFCGFTLEINPSLENTHLAGQIDLSKSFIVL